MSLAVSVGRALKRGLSALPFGTGAQAILLVRRVLLLRFVTGFDRSVKDEVERIRRSVEARSRIPVPKAVVVYDNLVSPPTYGDYLIMVMAARYFTAHDIPVEFYVVDSGRREDWAALSDADRATFTAAQIDIAEAFLERFPATVRRVTWAELSSVLAAAPRERLILFEERVAARRSFYNDMYNSLNMLMASTDDAVRSRYLLSREDIGDRMPAGMSPQPYVAWHCRYSERWGPTRNTSVAEFLDGYRILRRRFPKSALLVVSDPVGCAHFKEIARANGLDLLFSKDVSDSFLGDAMLVLGADFYFQKPGGGMGIVAMYSELPFEMHCLLTNESMWTWRKATSWQTARQTFIPF